MVNKNSKHAPTAPIQSSSELLIDVPVKEGHTKKKDTGVKKGKSLKSQKKSAKHVPHTSLNKREFLLKFLKSDANIVWPREMKIINSLLKIFPNEGFWLSLELKFKLNSLCWFLSDDGRKFLNLEYKKFTFEPEKPQIFDLKNNNIEFDTKLDPNKVAPISVREFLNLWRKKN